MRSNLRREPLYTHTMIARALIFVLLIVRAPIVLLKDRIAEPIYLIPRVDGVLCAPIVLLPAGILSLLLAVMEHRRGRSK